MGKAEMQQQYSHKQQQLTATRAQCSSIEGQLEFVRKQKGKLKTLKGNFKTNKADAVSVSTSIDITEWKGSNYGLFYDAYIQKLCNDKYKTFIDEVDHNLDALVTEERRLENELLENEGLIGKLKQGLNWLTSEIEKLTN